MIESTADRFGLGGVDQIGYVVRSLEESLPFYETLFGPFQSYEAELKGAMFRGQESDCTLKIASKEMTGKAATQFRRIVENQSAIG